MKCLLEKFQYRKNEDTTFYTIPYCGLFSGVHIFVKNLLCRLEVIFMVLNFALIVDDAEL